MLITRTFSMVIETNVLFPVDDKMRKYLAEKLSLRKEEDLIVQQEIYSFRESKCNGKGRSRDGYSNFVVFCFKKDY